jgi:flagella basal body P-ring formation protein FlgA
MKSLIAITLFGLSLFIGHDCRAGDKDISIVGRADIMVTSPVVTLADVADVSSTALHKHDEAIIVLKQTPLVSSPLPGKSKEISAQEILQILRAHQVNFEEVGYSLPSIINVTRASRQVKDDEIKAAIQDALATQGNQEIVIKELIKSSPVNIAPTMVAFTAEQVGIPHNGRLSFSVTATSPEGEKQSFTTQAYVEEWGHVPLAKRPLTRGTIVALEDVAMARLNLQTLPRDAVRNSDNVIGLEVSQDIAFGEFFKNKSIGIPALVKSGDKVAAVIRSNILEVTLKATALDSASLGGEIRIRNDSSKKVLRGKVVGEKLVEVTP